MATVRGIRCTGGAAQDHYVKEVIPMHKHYNDGPAAVRQARKAEANKQVERMTSMMVWMTYGWIVAAGVFLHAAGWM